MITDRIGLHFRVQVRMGEIGAERLTTYLSATNNGVERVWMGCNPHPFVDGKVKIFMNYKGEKVRAKKLIKYGDSIFVVYKRPNRTVGLALESEFRQNATLNEDN